MRFQLPDPHFLTTFLRRKLLFLILAAALVAALAAGLVLGVQDIVYASKAEVFIEDEQVVASFHITSKDQGDLKEFTKNLGVEGDFTKGLAVTLDRESLAYLRNFLPLETTLEIGPKSIKFGSSEPIFFGQGLEEKLLRSAQEEGSFKVRDLGGGNFEIEIDNPEQVLSSATESGKLKFSQGTKEQDLWQILSKLAKIKLKVGGRTIFGAVILR